MIIKKYQAKTESEAVEQAKKELGNGVVIMNVRNKKKKGLLSFIFPPVVEITVALEEENPPASPAGSLNTKPQGGLLPDDLIAQTTPASLREKDGWDPVPPGEMRSSAAGTGNDQTKPATTLTPRVNLEIPPAMPATEKPSAVGSTSGNSIPVNTTPVISAPASHAIEERLNNLQNLIEKQMNPDMSSQRHPQKDSHDKGESGEMDAFIRLLHDTMIDNEVSEENADIIINEIKSSAKPNMPMDHLLANVYQKMILKFGKSVGIRPADKGVKVVFFIGATGVGKTTTIAKIASRFRVEEKKRVALLTADTYRIAAAEQLSTYASILDVPFRIVYTPAEMSGALANYMDYDYVLVDTAGHSYYNESQKENMNQFIHSVDGLVESEVFLVLSATTKYRDLLNTADAYRNMTDYKLIFTKLDETTTLGSLLNLKLYTGTEISYVTCGQNVPDDIENFNPQKTVKQLLGGKRHNRQG